MDALELRHNDADDLVTSYDAGYADGIALLRTDRYDHSPIEPLQRSRARYLRYVELDNPTPGARAYIAGVRDVAADNLPCRSHSLPPRPRSQKWFS
jgi:hypothetical protein